jgi:hypothetical protein
VIQRALRKNTQRPRGLQQQPIWSRQSRQAGRDRGVHRPGVAAPNKRKTRRTWRRRASPLCASSLKAPGFDHLVGLAATPSPETRHAAYAERFADIVSRFCTMVSSCSDCCLRAPASLTRPLTCPCVRAAVSVLLLSAGARLPYIWVMNEVSDAAVETADETSVVT